MGILRTAVQAVERATSGPLSGIATPEKWVEEWWTGGIHNSAGVRVDQETAMTYAPYFAGVRVISEDVGGLPLLMYERLARGKQRATDHPLYTLLHDAPNDMMGALAFRENLTGHCMNWGRGAAYVVYHQRTGVIEELWPLRPDRLHVRCRRMGNGKFERWFQYLDDVNGIYANLAPGEVLFVGGVGDNGLGGHSIVELAANSIGLGLATEHYGAKTFDNNSAPGGILTHPDTVSDEARKRMRADWENLHRGINRAGLMAIMEEGVTWTSVGLPNDANQFLETRKLQVTDMSRWLRLPPHMIGDLDRATFSNIESQQLDYVSMALASWLTRWEQAIVTQLLLPEERATYFPEHLVDALLRGDTAARYAAYAIGRQWGWLSANDIRERENLNAIDGGDQYLVPLNMVPAAGSSDGGPARSIMRLARALRGRRSWKARANVTDAWVAKIADADQEVADLEAEKVGKLVDEHLPTPEDDADTDGGRGRRSVLAFLAALRTLYAEDGPIAERMTSLWLPIFTGFAGDVATEAAAEVGHEDDVDLSKWTRAYVKSHVGYRLSSSFGQLRKIADESEADHVAADIVARFTKWQDERPQEVARWEGNQLSNAAARETWKEAGVRSLKWVTQGSKTCPYCKKLDGATTPIEDPFISKGDELDGDAEGEKLTAKRNTFHPPVHVGCDCQVVPVP
ncbi:phage portal protein [Streptomyces griseorubiginosus]|uniref:phage portal protein n=1 Tax=Streptomyces griseorubiginosus TaxID=67304 RepID=UPI00369FCA24